MTARRAGGWNGPSGSGSPPSISWASSPCSAGSSDRNNANGSWPSPDHRDRVAAILRPTRCGAAMLSRALLLAGLGILFMAVVAATPGSPYQPPLPTGGQPHGILRDVAVTLPLDRLQGDPLLAIGVVAGLLATAAFLLLLREAFRGKVSVGAVAIVVVGAHALLLLVPLLFS